jgi:hypothetical protein
LNADGLSEATRMTLGDLASVDAEVESFSFSSGETGESSRESEEGTAGDACGDSVSESVERVQVTVRYCGVSSDSKDKDKLEGISSECRSEIDISSTYGDSRSGDGIGVRYGLLIIGYAFISA